MSKKLPHYSEKTTRWVGGDSHTLYLFTDKRTHAQSVVPGHRDSLRKLGPELTVRVATRQEAERHWQNPLHSGWKVEEEARPKCEHCGEHDLWEEARQKLPTRRGGVRWISSYRCAACRKLTHLTTPKDLRY